ncbi:hypothetical protein [Methanogenium cariaci]|jgi:hypothetical protein
MTDSTIHIERTSITGDEREYIVCHDESKTEERFLIREKKRAIAQNDVWHTEIYEINPDGAVSTNAFFGGGSYYRTDDQGAHLTIGPIDMEYLIAVRSTGADFFGSWLAIALGFDGPVGVALARSLIDLLPISASLSIGPDYHLNMFFSHLNIALIPNNVALPGLQSVVVRLGSSYKVLIL